jgi:hypothetical protein
MEDSKNNQNDIEIEGSAIDQNLTAEVKNLNKDKNEIDFEEVRFSQDFEGMIGIKKEISIVPVRKPGRQDWFQVNPDEKWHSQFALIEIKEDRETYLVTKEVYPELVGEYIPKYIFTCQTRQGVTFFWPVKMPGPDGRLDSWNQSALRIVNEYVGRWIRVVSNMGVGGYDVYTTEAEFPPPVWPSEGFHSLLKKAFRDKIVDRLDHPIIKRLRGQI